MSAHPEYQDDSTWVEIPGYDASSRANHCSVNGTNRKGDRVFRGPQIDFEGFFDVSELALEQGARLIGWIPPEEFEAMREESIEVDSANGAMGREIASLRDQVRTLTLQNAELYAQIEHLENPEVLDGLPPEGEAWDEEGEIDIDAILAMESDDHDGHLDDDGYEKSIG